MQITAKLRYLRISPRKVRLVADLIRGKKVDKAQAILDFTTKKASPPILKLLKSAISNAKNNFQLEETNLYISKITVDEGPKFKRWIARARGRADEILKRSSHITIVLDEIKPSKKKKIAKKVKAERKKEQIKPEPAKIAEEPEKISEIKKPPKMRPERKRRKPKLGRAFKRIFKRKAF